MLLLCVAAIARGEPPAPPTIELRLRNHLFEPSELHIPAYTKMRLRVENLDVTPEEFASWDLNRKKMIPGNHTATLYIGPLRPGSYPFFGEFNPKTALGQLTVQ
jgi:heme/copper-type cytochrome/quinol oxidase subunit 2